MKPKNFPGRKNSRRMVALENAQITLKFYNKKENIDGSKLTPVLLNEYENQIIRLGKEIETLNLRLAINGESVRTKKNRSDKVRMRI